MQVSSFCWVAVRGNNNWYGYNHHPFRNLSLGFILNIFLKLCKFQPRYSYKIFSYRKKRVYNNKKILVAKPNYWSKQRPRLNFWKWAPFINIKLRPLCDRQRSYFWKVKSLKKKLSLRSSSIHNLIAAKKKQTKKQMQKLKSNEKYCMEFSFQNELVPFSESKILRQVVCAVQFEIQSELYRNSTLICRAIKYNHWTYRYFVFTVREVCLCWPVVKTRAKKKKFQYPRRTHYLK